jgi:hypothetical protein
VLSGFQVKRLDVGENALAGKPTAADPLTLFGHKKSCLSNEGQIEGQVGHHCPDFSTTKVFRNA